jgi:hypothetical protein
MDRRTSRWVAYGGLALILIVIAVAFVVSRITG